MNVQTDDEIPADLLAEAMRLSRAGKRKFAELLISSIAPLAEPIIVTETSASGTK